MTYIINKKIIRSFLLIVGLTLSASVFYSEAIAGEWTVNSPQDYTDINPGDGHCDSERDSENPDLCTLRAAIMEANASSGSDTIILPAGTYQLTLQGAGDDTGAKGDLDILSRGGNLTIRGDGANATIINGMGNDRVFDLIAVEDHSSNVQISGVTITGGNVPGNVGGGINMYADSDPIDLTLREVRVTGNKAGAGGGISAFAKEHNTLLLTILNSEVSHNRAELADGQAEMTAAGGGIAVMGRVEAVIVNTTLSNNWAETGGGGIFTNSLSPPHFSSCTITENSSALLGGGVAAITTDQQDYTVSIVIKNTILARNIAPFNSDCADGSLVTSEGYNLIGDGTGCNFTAKQGDQVGNTSDPLNPILIPLANNGGETQTHAIQNGSPVIDAGNPDGCTDSYDVLLATDQRGAGYDRHVGSACDMGAYESNAEPTDLCPEDLNKTEPGLCGCGVADTDTDRDGTPDCQDTEECDELDNDGDLVIDEGCNCDNGQTRPCGTDVGECNPGTQVCENGTKWSDECTGQTAPTDEICDNLDNNCDGTVDEGVTNACGACGDVPTEVCDGEDNDCDGEADEGLSCDSPPGLSECVDQHGNDAPAFTEYVNENVGADEMLFLKNEESGGQELMDQLTEEEDREEQGLQNETTPFLPAEVEGVSYVMTYQEPEADEEMGSIIFTSADGETRIVCEEIPADITMGGNGCSLNPGFRGPANNSPASLLIGAMMLSALFVFRSFRSNGYAAHFDIPPVVEGSEEDAMPDQFHCSAEPIAIPPTWAC